MIESVLSIVDAAAIESVPPEIVSGSVEVRLLIESVTSRVNDIRGDVDRDVVARSRNAVRAPIRRGVPVVVACRRPSRSRPKAASLAPSIRFEAEMTSIVSACGPVAREISA